MIKRKKQKLRLQQRTFKSRLIQNFYFSINQKKNTYSCKLCNQTFSTKSNYNRHVNKEELCINKKQLNEFINLQHTSLNELNVLVEDQNKIIQEQIIQEFIEESVEQKVTQLKFDGIFQGKENDIRVTPNKQISVFDFIKVVGGQTNPRETWKNILKNHQDEVVQFLDNIKFPGKGQKLTPVINVQGMVKLLFWLPGELAKQFRSKSAEVMIRYLGGDITLINEIKMIDQEHINNPNNIAQVFREEVTERQGNLIFNQDQINTSKRLINYYGDKRDIFYMFSFKYLEEWYAKYGMVGEVRDFHQRVQQHISEFQDICFHNVLQCSNINKVESDFKETALFQMNKVKIPKKYGGNHTEVIKLSEIVTTEIIKEEMIKVAGDIHRRDILNKLTM